MKYIHHINAIDELLEKQEYFNLNRFECAKNRKYIEAEMWEKKSKYTSKVIINIINKALSL